MIPQFMMDVLSHVYLGNLNAVTQYLLLLCAGLLITIIFNLLHLYRRMKGREAAGETKVKMNCWFCSQDVYLEFGEKDSWECPHCEQYNGFTEDGDYSQPVSGHFDVKDFKTQTICSPSEFIIAKSVLCETCNQNQTLKVRQLAAFVPFSEASYDDEVNVYRAYLENRYQLCDTCSRQVSQYLTVQDHKLAVTMTDGHKSLLHQLSVKRERGCYDSPLEAATCCKQTILPCLMFSLCMCAGVTRLVLAVTHYAASTSPQNMSHVVDITLPDCLVVWSEQTCVYFGGVFCVAGLLAVGKYSLYPEDVVHVIMWLLLVLIDSSLQAAPLSWLCLGREIILFITTGTVLLSFICCLRHRLPRHFTAVTIHKKQICPSDHSLKASAQYTEAGCDEVQTVDTECDDSDESDISSCAPCGGSDPQVDSVHQHLESLSLGLIKKSGSTCSVWSLPAIVSSSPMSPDSTTQPSGHQSQKVLSPSRLGFLTLESAGRNGQCRPSVSPGSWAQVSGNHSSPAHNINNSSQDLLQPGLSCSVFQPGLKRSVSASPNKPPSHDHVYRISSHGRAYKSPSCTMQSRTFLPDVGPCDSQTPDTFCSGVKKYHFDILENGRNSWRDKSCVSMQRTRNMPAQSVPPDSSGLRRSQRLAMSGKLPKPWPLKKSLSCTNLSNCVYQQKSRSWRDRATVMQDRWAGNVISPSQISQLPPVQEVTARSGRAVRDAGTDILPGDQDVAASEFSDDEFDDSDNMQQIYMSRARTRNDFPWTWLLIGVVMGASLTTNFFLICRGWWAHAGSL